MEFRGRSTELLAKRLIRSFTPEPDDILEQRPLVHAAHQGDVFMPRRSAHETRLD